MKRSVHRSILAIGSALAIAVATTGAAYAVPAVNEQTAIAAVQDVAPDALDSSVSARESADAGVAATSEAGGVTVSFPNNASSGSIGIESASATTLTMGLPIANQGADPQVVDGAVVYDSGDGSQIVTSLGENGELTTLSVISDANAPDSYAYEMGVPDGGSLELGEAGDAAVLGADGTTIAYSPAPWAKDANGATVPTWYTVEGNTLVQHVDLASPSIAFPVVADPQWWTEWWGYVFLLSKAETKNAGGNAAYAGVIGAACGYIPIVTIRVACVAVVGAKAVSLVNVTREAGAQGRCLQINVPFPVGGVGFSYLAMNFTNVPCRA